MSIDAAHNSVERWRPRSIAATHELSYSTWHRSGCGWRITIDANEMVGRSKAAEEARPVVQQQAQIQPKKEDEQ
jgi:hypothetical protein